MIVEAFLIFSIACSGAKIIALNYIRQHDTEHETVDTTDSTFSVTGTTGISVNNSTVNGQRTCSVTISGNGVRISNSNVNDGFNPPPPTR